jgi:hypothetical protein
MRDEAHNEFSDEAPPHALTFAFNMIVSIPLEFVLQVIILHRGGGPA